MAVVESCACPNHFCTRLSGTPAVTAATPNPWRKPFGLACGATHTRPGHGLAHPSPPGHPAPGPQAMAAAAIGAPLEGPEAMDEVKHIDQRVRHRDHPTHPRPAFLQGLEDDEIRP